MISSVHASSIRVIKKFFICTLLMLFGSSSSLLAMRGISTVAGSAIKQGLGAKVVSFLKGAACMTEAVAETSVKGFTQKTCPFVKLTQSELASGVRELAQTYATQPFQPLVEALLKESVENATLQTLSKVENESVLRLRNALESHIKEIKKTESTGLWGWFSGKSKIDTTKQITKDISRALEATNLDVQIKNLGRLPEGKNFLESFLDAFKKDEAKAWQEVETLLEKNINNELASRVQVIQSVDTSFLLGAIEKSLVGKDVLSGRVQGVAQKFFPSVTFSDLGGKGLSGLVGDTVAIAPVSMQAGGLVPVVTEVASQPLASKSSIVEKTFEEEVVSKAKEISSAVKTTQKSLVPRPFGGLQPFSTPSTALQKYSQPSTALQKIPQPSLVQSSLVQPTLPHVSSSALIPFVPKSSSLTVPALVQSSALAVFQEPVAHSLQPFSTPFTAVQKYTQPSTALQKISQPSVRSLAPFVPKSSALTASVEPLSPALVPFRQSQQALVSVPVEVSSLVPVVPQSSALTVPLKPLSMALVPVSRTPIRGTPVAQTVPSFSVITQRTSLPVTKPVGLVKKTVPLTIPGQPTAPMLSKNGLPSYFDPRTIIAATKLRKEAVSPQQAIVPLGVPTAQEILAGAGDRSLIEGYASTPMTDTEATFLGGMLNALSKIANAAPGELAPITIPDVVVSKVLALGEKHNLVLVWVRQNCLPAELILEGPSSLLTDAQGGVISLLGHTGSNGYLPMAVQKNLLTQFGGSTKKHSPLSAIKKVSAVQIEAQSSQQLALEAPSISAMSATIKDAPQLALDLPSVVTQKPLITTEVRAPTTLEPVVVPEDSGDQGACVQPMLAVDTTVKDEQSTIGQSWADKIVAGVQRQASTISQLSPDDVRGGIQRLAVSLIPPYTPKQFAENAEKIASLKKKHPLLKTKKTKETAAEKLVRKEGARLHIVAKIRAEQVVEKDLIDEWMKDGGPSWKEMVSPSGRRIKEKKQQAHDLFDAYNGILALRGKDRNAQESLEQLKLTILVVLGEDESRNAGKALAGIRERLDAALVKNLLKRQLYYGKV